MQIPDTRITEHAWLGILQFAARGLIMCAGRMATSWTPSHWPIVERGLLMAGIGDVMFVHMGAQSEEVFERHLKELALAIDTRNDASKVGVIYDIPTPLDTDAKRRQRSARVLDERRDKLARTTAGFALVTPSTLVRGTLRAVFWLAPPPYEWRVVGTVSEGLAFLETKSALSNVRELETSYARLRASVPAGS
jgi:hypothetical protein